MWILQHVGCRGGEPQWILPYLSKEIQFDGKKLSGCNVATAVKGLELEQKVTEAVILHGIYGGYEATVFGFRLNPRYARTSHIRNTSGIILI